MGWKLRHDLKRCMAKSSYSSVTLFQSSIKCRCPRCGRGQLFSGLLTVVRVCPSCGLEIGDQDSGDGPAVFVVLILGFLVVGAAASLELAVSPPMWLHLFIWTPVILGGSILLLRPIKSLIVALQFKHGMLRVSDKDESQ